MRSVEEAVAGGACCRPYPLLTGQPTITGDVIDVDCEEFSDQARRYIVHAVHHSLGLLGLFDLVLLSSSLLALHFRRPELDLGDVRAPLDLRLLQYVVAFLSAAVDSPVVLAAFVMIGAVVVRVAFKNVQVKSEELLAVQGIGLQLTARNALGRVVSQRFVDISIVRALFVHEGYFRHQAIFYMAAVLEDQQELLVFFSHSLPRLDALQAILCGVRAVLYQEPEHGPSLAEIGMTNAQLQ